MFDFFPLTILFIALIWIYQDGLQLRKKGVPVNPGLVVGLIVLAYYLFLWIGISSYVFYKILGYSWLSYPFQLIIPILAYLILRYTRYRKIASLGNPPLPPTRRWGFWFMLAAIFAPIIFPVLSFLFFASRAGW